MADPYSELDAAPRAVQERIADAIDARCMDPAQIEMRRRYLSRLSLPEGARAVEFGSGTGHVTRDMIEVAGAAEALGIEPSRVMIERARSHYAAVPGLSFQVGGAEATGLSDCSVDLVVMHTLLCHAPQAGAIVAEAARILKPGAALAVLDGDYDLSSVALSAHDPLQALIDRMIAANVHDRWLPRRLPGLLGESGFGIDRFEIFGYTAADDPAYFLTVIDRGADALTGDGVLAPETAAALKAEARRRVDADIFFGSMSYISVIARRI
jgi:ubiquinone/menaquinone biosynthesis C-methylase UbiE